MTSGTTALAEDLDLLRIGGQSGYLWTSGPSCLAGVGVARRIPVTLADKDSVQEACETLQNLMHGGDREPIAFAALPFDPNYAGELVVPRVLAGTDGEDRWITIADPSLGVDQANELLRAAGVPSSGSGSSDFSVRSIHPPEYWRDEIVAKAINEIKSGRLNKTVLARELEIVADSDFDHGVVLERLHKRYPTAIRFNVEGFLGASPELLVARQHQIVSAHPLAGTAPRFEDEGQDQASADDLEASVKNQWEHRITINWLLDNLLPFCSYVDAEPEPKIVTLANVHHLGTRVEGLLSSPAAHVLELVAALHPTPAVGGAPQDEALRVIAELEQAERHQYAGPVGWVDASGNGAFAVGIRSATIKGNTARLFAGVGVVADSEPQSELDETESKFQTMRNALTRD